jgi:hypothetical protein
VCEKRVRRDRVIKTSTPLIEVTGSVRGERKVSVCVCVGGGGYSDLAREQGHTELNPKPSNLKLKPYTLIPGACL